MYTINYCTDDVYNPRGLQPTIMEILKTLGGPTIPPAPPRPAPVQCHAPKLYNR